MGGCQEARRIMPSTRFSGQCPGVDGTGGSVRFDSMPDRRAACAACQRNACFRRYRQRADKTVSRSEEHTSELQSLMRISYAVFCLNKQNNTNKLLVTQHILTK